MAGRPNRGTDFQNFQETVELHNRAAHAHTVGQLHGQQDHLTGAEHARQEFEREQDEKRHEHQPAANHGIHPFGHAEIEQLAYQLWEARGCPQGSPEIDWFEAVKELRLRAVGRE